MLRTQEMQPCGQFRPLSIRIISPPCARKLRCTRGKSQHAESGRTRTCRLRPACGLPDGGSPCCAATHSGLDIKLAAGNLLPSTHSIEQRARELKSYRRQPRDGYQFSGRVRATVPSRNDVIWRNCVQFRARRERLNGTPPSAGTGVFASSGRLHSAIH